MTNGYAQIAWTVEDIQTIREDWTDAQARDFLERNEGHLRDRLTELGWDVIESLIAFDDACEPTRTKGDDDGQEYGDPRDYREGKE